MKQFNGIRRIVLGLLIAFVIVVPIFASPTTYTFSGVFASHETYSHPVTLNEGDYVIARELCDEVSAGNRPVDPYLRVNGPNGNQVAANDDGYQPTCNSFSSSCVNFVAAETGTYMFIAGQAASSGGPYTVTVVVNDHNQVCSPQPPYFTSSASVNTPIGTSFSYTFTVVAMPPATISYSNEDLPPGVTRTGDTLSGTPTAVGEYHITATAQNGYAPDATLTLVITVTEAPVITSPDSATVTANSAFSHTFTAVGIPAPTLSYSNENLPPGVTRTGNTLSGVPTVSGTYSITVIASNGIAPDAVQTFILTVGALPVPPASPFAEDVNFDAEGAVRTGIPETLVDSIHVRVLYQNGQPTHWMGGDLYNAGSIGNQGVLDMGVLQAIDIFSPNGMNYFYGGAVFCLRGEGTLIWLAAKNAPRVAEIIGSYTVDDFPGYTCATLFEPGTLVLVNRTSAGQ